MTFVFIYYYYMVCLSLVTSYWNDYKTSYLSIMNILYNVTHIKADDLSAWCNRSKNFRRGFIIIGYIAANFKIYIRPQVDYRPDDSMHPDRKSH